MRFLQGGSAFISSGTFRKTVNQTAGRDLPGRAGECAVFARLAASSLSSDWSVRSAAKVCRIFLIATRSLLSFVRTAMQRRVFLGFMDRLSALECFHLQWVDSIQTLLRFDFSIILTRPFECKGGLFRLLETPKAAETVLDRSTNTECGYIT